MQSGSEPVVLVARERIHARVELFLFADSKTGPYHVLCFSGGHGRLPSLQKGQGPLPDLEYAHFVRDRIVDELKTQGYAASEGSAPIWELYARGEHKKLKSARAERPGS